MASKLVTTVVVVALLAAAAGVTGYVVINSDKLLDKDTLNTDVSVGDYYTLNVNSVTKSWNPNYTDKTGAELLDSLYYSGGGEPVRTETLDYKGESILCNVYAPAGYNYYVDQNSSFIFKTVGLFGDIPILTATVIDTNLDTTKTRAQATISAGTYVLATMGTIEEDGMTIDVKMETTVMTYDGTNAKVRDATIYAVTGSQTFEVVSVESGMVTVYGSVNPMTMNEYLSKVSVDHFKASMTDEGVSMTFGEKTTKIADTLLGKRSVTVQTIDLEKGQMKEKAVLTYGVDGVLYHVEMNGGEPGSSTSTVYDLVKSSLLTTS